MSVRKIYEAELDGCSVIIWEAGNGTRVIYPTEQAAETATNWLITQANKFHEAKEANEGAEDEHMVSVVVYGDQPMTEFEFVQNYMARMKSVGYELIPGLVRKPKEIW